MKFNNLIKVILLLGIIGFVCITSSAEAEASWWSPLYPRCKNITITNPTSTTHTNMPVLINITYESEMSLNFSDVRFVGGPCDGGSALLDYEEDYRVNGSFATYWVEIPSLGAGDTTISIYYGNRSLASQEDPAGTWASEFTNVFHFEEGSGNLISSTSNAATGVPEASSGITYQDRGVIGHGYQFSGTNSMIELDDDTADLSDDFFTVCFWEDHDAASDATFWFQQDGSRYAYYLTNDNFYYRADNTGGSAAGTTTSTGVWNYICVVANNDIGEGSDYIEIYLNGVSKATDSTGQDIDGEWSPGPTGWEIGSLSGGNDYDGHLDEMWYTNDAKGDDWINTSYQLVANYDQWITTGVESSAPGTWWNPDYPLCQNISITSVANTPLRDFPAYFNVSYNNNMQPNFSDIRFVSAGCADGGTDLEYEVENYTISNSAEVWVKIKELPASGKTISVYYGNNSVLTGANPAEVWTNNYVAVHHLSEPSGYANDSSGNDNNLTNYGDGITYGSPGKVDGAVDFAGTGDYFHIASPNNMFNAKNLTVEMWLEPDDLTRAYEFYGGHTDVNNWLYGWGFWSNNDDTMHFFTTHYANNDATTTHSTAMTYWVGAYDITEANEVRLFKDGVFVASANDDNGYLEGPDGYAIGSDTGSTYEMDGKTDGWKVSNVTRSDDWINMSFRMVSNQTTLIVFGTEQNETAPAPPADPCPYGGSGDFTIDCSNGCNFTSITEGDGSDVIITGNSGSVVFTADVINFKYVYKVGGQGCKVYWLGGSMFKP